MTINILTICDYGQVRSVGMKCFINGIQRGDNERIDKLNYDVIAIGSVTSSKKTRKLLKQWADIVIDVRKWIPLDKYGNPWHDELQSICKQIWEDICLNPKYKEVFAEERKTAPGGKDAHN